MTRVVSFGLYQCGKCGQIHLKPEYGSVSIYVPSDLLFNKTDLKLCSGCKKEFQFKDYIYLGSKRKKSTTYPSKLELVVRKLVKRPYIEIDVRKLYPMFD